MYGQTLHISTLICVDETTADNGCLELVRGVSVCPYVGNSLKKLLVDSFDAFRITPKA